MEAKEEPGILSWMWDTVKDHPYYTIVGAAGFILVGKSVASYWGYNKYTKKAAVGYDVGDDPHAYDVQNEVQIIIRGAPPHQEPAPQNEEPPAVGDGVQVGNPFGVIVPAGDIPPDADSDQPDKQPASPNNTYNHLDTIPEDISFADIENRFGDNDELNII